MKKRLLQVLLSITMMICMMPVVKAEEKVEMKDAMVSNTECINEYVLEVINQYVSINDQDQFYITDDTTLRSLVTQEQYDVICAQIKARNNATNLTNAQVYPSQAASKIKSKGSVSTLSASAVGTAGNPYILTKGVTKSTTANNYAWFECTIAGGIQFKLYASKTASYIVYKKSLFGLTQLTSGTVQNNNILKYAKDKLYGNNRIQIKIYNSSTTAYSVSCMINQKAGDSITVANLSREWIALSDSSRVDNSLLYKKYVFYTKDAVGNLYNIVSNDKTINCIDKVARGTMSVSVALATLGIPKNPIISESAAHKIGVTIFGTTTLGTAISDPVQFKNSLLRDIYNQAGYTGIVNNIPQFKYGVVWIEYLYNGVPCYTVQRWTGSVCVGPAGWAGKWVY